MVTGRGVKAPVEDANAVGVNRGDDCDVMAAASVVVGMTPGEGATVGAEVAPQLQHAASGATPW